jgi:uncharacterized protein (DUF305 family)
MLAHGTDAVGHANYRMEFVGLQPSTETQPRKPMQVEQNFFHEVVHHVATAVDIKELEGNEDKVQLVAAALHQIFTSMEGDCPMMSREEMVKLIAREGST